MPIEFDRPNALAENVKEFFESKSKEELILMLLKSIKENRSDCP